MINLLAKESRCRCARCHDTEGDLLGCGCGSRFHDDCGPCPTLGCGEISEPKEELLRELFTTTRNFHHSYEPQFLGICGRCGRGRLPGPHAWGRCGRCKKSDKRDEEEKKSREFWDPICNTIEMTTYFLATVFAAFLIQLMGY